MEMRRCNEVSDGNRKRTCQSVVDALFEGQIRARPCSCCLCKTMLHLLSDDMICPWKPVGNQCRTEKLFHCLSGLIKAVTARLSFF